jgi:hypothetical protein
VLFAIVGDNTLEDVDTQISYKKNLRERYRVNGLYQGSDPEIKWRYLVRTVPSMSDDLKIKLKVFLCINPDYKITLDNGTYDAIVGVTSTIDILRRGTTSWNREHINVIHPQEVDDELIRRLQESDDEFYIVPIQSKLPLKRKVYYSFSLEVEDGFCKADKVKHVSYRGMTSVMRIGHFWMSQCSELRSVNFTGLRNLMSVDGHWMSHCFNLTDINFSDLRRLKSVGHMWMYRCIRLESPHFEGLGSLTTVGDTWMHQCESLVSPDFTALKELRKVGDCWMMGNDALKSPNFNGLTALTTVGNNWMCDCEGLVSPNFEGLDSLKTVGPGWMNTCPLLNETAKQFKIDFERKHSSDGGKKKSKGSKKMKKNKVRRSRK